MHSVSDLLQGRREVIAQNWIQAISDTWPQEVYQPSQGWIDSLLILLQRKNERSRDLHDYVQQHVSNGELQAIGLSDIIHRFQLLAQVLFDLASGEGEEVHADIQGTLDDLIFWSCDERDALRRQEIEEPDRLIETASLLYFELNNSGHFINGNKAAMTLFGQTGGANFSRRVHPQDLPLFVRSLGLVNEGEPQIVELRVQPNGGEGEHYLTMTMTPVHQQEDISKVRVVASDVTHEHELQEALRNSEEKYRALIEQSHDAIFIFALEDGRILDVNQQAIQMTGKSKFDLVHDDILSLFPEQRQAAIDLLQTTIHQGAGNFRHMELVGAGQRKIIVEVSANIVEYGDSRVVLSLVKDIGHRRSLEQQLSTAQSELTMFREEIERCRQQLSLFQRDAVAGAYAKDIVEGITNFLQDMQQRMESVSDHISGEPLRTVLLCQDMAEHWWKVCDMFASVDEKLHQESEFVELDRLLETTSGLLIGSGHNVQVAKMTKRIPPVRNEKQMVERIVLGVLHMSCTQVVFDSAVKVQLAARGNMAILEVKFQRELRAERLGEKLIQNIYSSFRLLAESLGGSVLTSFDATQKWRITILLPLLTEMRESLEDFDIVPFDEMESPEGHEE